jgi:hypothetical protein
MKRSDLFICLMKYILISKNIHLFHVSKEIFFVSIRLFLENAWLSLFTHTPEPANFN